MTDKMTELKWADLVAVFPEGHKHNNKDAAGDLLWWAAYDQAEDMRDCNSIKDWAQFLQDGYPAMETNDVVQYVNTQIEDRIEEQDMWSVANEAEAKRCVLNRIRKFYELPLVGEDKGESDES